MTQLLFYLAGGTVFLATAAALVAAATIGFIVGSGALGRFLAGSQPFLIAGILLTAPPLPPGSLWFWGLLGIAWMIETQRRTRRGLTLSGPIAGVLVAGTLLAAVFEIPRLRPPVLSSPPPAVHVAGDSLSAGIGGDIRTWPEILAEKTGLPVRNHSAPGARLRDGPEQLQNAGATEADTLFLILLGGNDVLLRIPPADYERDLRRLLEGAEAAGLQVVLFELPVVPGFRRYGRIQRNVAGDFEVRLVPSRTLARIFRDPQHTSDGIHLTDTGHRALANTVSSLWNE